MSKPDLRLVSDEELTEFLAKSPDPPPSRGGDGPSGPLEAKLARLETDMREIKANTRAIGDALLRIEGKVDAKASAVDLAEIKGKLDSKASAADVGALSGKLNDKPDTWKVVTIVLALGAIMAGSQIVKTIADVIHPPTQQTTKSQA